MLTSTVAPCMAGWMLQRLSSRRSSTRFSAEPGPTLGISSSQVFCVGCLKSVLGDEFTWASWLQHPLSGYGLRFFLKAFELGKLTGNYLVEFQHKPKVYTNGYRSPYEKYEQRFPGGIAAMLNDLTEAERMEFRPWVEDIGFPLPLPDDPRARKPKVDEADYAEKLKAHNAFLMERDVYQEIQYDCDDFSLLTSVVAEAYGPNFFSYGYITRDSSDFEIRKKYRIISAEGYPLHDSTLREPFNASYILACLERTLQSTEGQGKEVINAVYTMCCKTQRAKHFFCVLSQMLCACETFTLIFIYLTYKDDISYIMKVHGVRVFSTPPLKTA